LAACNEVRKHAVSLEEVSATLVMIGMKGDVLSPLENYFRAVNELHRLFNAQPSPNRDEIATREQKANKAYNEVIIGLGVVFRTL
jgi:hypothetical protein